MDMSIIASARLRERPFEYAANGVTVVLKDGFPAGTTGKVQGDNSGKIYTAVNETQLRAIINEGDANTDLTGFCTTLVTNMEGTQPDLEVIPFINVDSNQNISSWDVSNVTDMTNMFNRATSFNQPLNNWNVSNVTNMREMFRDSAFNKNINSWDVSNVLDMTAIFQDATSFDQPLNSWNLSSVTTMPSMFVGATSFNQPLNNWDVSNVINISGVFFGASSFNQPLDNWDVSSATNMVFMFWNASSFNQDLSMWCVTNFPSKPTYFDLDADDWVLPNSRPIWGTCP
jgi:surface protein